MTLPATLGKLVSLAHLGDVNAHHGLTQTLADTGQHLGVLVVSHGLDDGLGALLRVTRLEDTGADKDTVAAQLHHESGICGSGNTTGGKVDDGQTATLSGLAEKLVGDSQLAGIGAQLGLGVGRGGEDGAGAGNVRVDLADVLDSLDDITSTGLTLGADHGSTLRDTAEGLTQVAATADEGDLEGGLGDVVEVISRREDFRLVDVVDTNGLKDLTRAHPVSLRMISAVSV